MSAAPLELAHPWNLDWGDSVRCHCCHIDRLVSSTTLGTVTNSHPSFDVDASGVTMELWLLHRWGPPNPRLSPTY